MINFTLDYRVFSECWLDMLLNAAVQVNISI